MITTKDLAPIDNKSFENLPKVYDKLKFKYFTIGVTVHEYVASTYFKFYV